MIDHVTLRVSDLEKSRTFYQAALGAIGYKESGPHDETAYGYVVKDYEDDSGHLWIVGDEDYVTKGVHVAFGVKNTEAVQKFYNAALAAGGRDNGAPGPRPEYGDNYYGAFVLDPDGNNIEATCYT